MTSGGDGGVRALCDDSRDRLVVLDSGSMLPKTLSWLDDQDLLFVKRGGVFCDDSRDWVDAQDSITSTT